LKRSLLAHLSVGDNARILLAFLVVPLLWGLNWTFMKVGLQTLPPFLYLGTRQLVVGTFFVVVARLNGRPLPRGSYLAWSVALGLLMTGVSNGAMYWGAQFIPSGLASILFGTMPLFAAIFANWWTDERLNRISLAGIVTGFVGVAVLLGGEAASDSSLAILGEAAALLSAVTWALPLVLSRRLLQGQDTVALTGVQMLSGALLLGPLAILGGDLGIVRITMDGMIALAYTIVLAGAAGFLLYFWLLKRIGAARLALTSFMTPVVAVIAGIVTLGESAGANLVAGLLLIAAGILMVTILGGIKSVAAAAPLVEASLVEPV
jgi:drug/metabolite transporter (DMT)-like permease